jgi:cytochrome c biogenesis protein CcdA
VIDAADEAMRLLGARSPLAIPVLFGAGAMTSVGPCIAPRYVALAALAQRSRTPWRTAAAFAAGVISAYVAIGAGAELMAGVRAWSTAIDLVLAASLAAGGGIMLLRDEENSHAHDAPRGGNSGAYLLGAMSALVVSPCCTPIVAAIAGLAMLDARPLEVALLVTAFAAGHVAPLGAAVVLGARGTHTLTQLGAASGNGVIAGTFMLALAAYYGLRA